MDLFAANTHTITQIFDDISSGRAWFWSCIPAPPNLEITLRSAAFRFKGFGVLGVHDGVCRRFSSPCGMVSQRKLRGNTYPSAPNVTTFRIQVYSLYIVTSLQAPLHEAESTLRWVCSRVSMLNNPETRTPLQVASPPSVLTLYVRQMLLYINTKAEVVREEVEPVS